MNRTKTLLDRNRSVLLYLEKITALLTHQELDDLASEALSILIQDSGATAGSLLYTARRPLRLRQGELSAPLISHMEQWETHVERRIAAGPWKIVQQEEPLSAWLPIKQVGQVLMYSLLLDGHEVAGTICLVFPQQQAPTGDQRAALTAFIQAIGSAMGLIDELSSTRERLGQLALFYQVAQSMASTVDLDKVLDDTIELATAILDASASVLMLVDEDSGELVFEYAKGEMGYLLRKQRTRLDEGIAGWVATHGVPVIVNDVHSDPRFSPLVDTRTGFLTRSVVCAPLKIRGKIVGVLEALNKRGEGGFDSEDLGLMTTTANQAAIAIDNAWLYQSLRDERDRVIQAQENVRRQVARNLHDGTVQYLAAISMSINHLEDLVERKPEAVKAELDVLRDLARQATRQARLALFELRPLILETQGLRPALEAYVQQLQGSEVFGIHFDAPDTLPDLEPSVAATIFSIVQEAMTNVKKHAAARDVWLRLSREDGWLQVIVEDNGKGFDFEAVDREYDQRGSIGLLTMRERAELIEGYLKIESNTTPPQSGTKVILRVPLSDTVAKEPA